MSILQPAPILDHDPAESFADDLRAAVFGPIAPTASAPTPPAECPHEGVPAHESCWWNGFCLGLAGVDADPPAGYSAFEAELFADGWDKGRRELEAEERVAFLALLADRVDEPGDGWPEAERVEAMGAAAYRVAEGGGR